MVNYELTIAGKKFRMAKGELGTFLVTPETLTDKEIEEIKKEWGKKYKTHPGKTIINERYFA